MSKNFSEFDLQMTRRAVDLAVKGIGQVSPSPVVCVIVAADGKTVGEQIDDLMVFDAENYVNGLFN